MFSGDSPRDVFSTRLGVSPEYVYMSSLTDTVEMETRRRMKNMGKNTKQLVSLEYYPPDEAREFTRHMCASFKISERNFPCGLTMYNNSVDRNRQTLAMKEWRKKHDDKNSNRGDKNSNSITNRRKIPKHVN
jgi:hypothetical protein